MQGGLMLTQNSRVLRVETETGATQTLPSGYPPRKLLTVDISPGGEHIAMSGEVIQVTEEVPKLPPSRMSTPIEGAPLKRVFPVLDSAVQVSSDVGLADAFEETLVIAPQRRQRSKKATKASKGGGSGHEASRRSPIEVWNKSSFVEQV